MPVDPHASRVGLHMAAMSGDIKAVRSLIRNPATDIEERDLLGDSGLLKAVRYGHLEVAQALLGVGADVNAQDSEGWTCLHSSVANGHKEAFFAVLAGTHEDSAPPADIEAMTSSGDTPLHMAAYHRRDWAVSALLRLGADRRATNHQGRRPIDVARHESTRTMLLLPFTGDDKERAFVGKGVGEAPVSKEHEAAWRTEIDDDRENRDRAGARLDRSTGHRGAAGGGGGGGEEGAPRYVVGSRDRKPIRHDGRVLFGAHRVGGLAASGGGEDGGASSFEEGSSDGDDDQ